MTETMTIRTARPDDLARVDALLARAYPRLLRPDYPPSVMVLALPIIARARPELLSSGTYFVAETAEGEILGAGGWTPGRGALGRADVRHVVTDDRATRRGIGRAILSRVFETATAAGIRGLDCQSTRTAVPFYRALGFQPIRQITIPLAPGIAFPAMLLQRRL
ncbi:MAG: GNAT family N-acetyltransferase [Paracoccaceae bacterium]